MSVCVFCILPNCTEYKLERSRHAEGSRKWEAGRLVLLCVVTTTGYKCVPWADEIPQPEDGAAALRCIGNGLKKV